MAKERTFSLSAVRTDGWFERIGEGIGSFQALCDIVGESFFAFSMITGVRITALTVDRRNPDNTLVDFVIATPGAPDWRLWLIAGSSAAAMLFSKLNPLWLLGGGGLLGFLLL